MPILTNVGSAYDAIVASKELGFVRIDLTGVTAIDFEVYVSKIGTGIQSWQLWNATDNAQIGVIDDPAASAAGDKFLQATFQIVTPIVGVKRLRVRAKSTVSTDDPNFYGSSIRLIRG